MPAEARPQGRKTGGRFAGIVEELCERRTTQISARFAAVERMDRFLANTLLLPNMKTKTLADSTSTRAIHRFDGSVEFLFCKG